MSLGRLLRTVRYLKPVQIYGRAIRRLPEPAPPMVGSLALAQATWPQWAAPAMRLPTLRDDGTFEVLGEAHDLDAVGWDDPEIAKLWRYNLHYFDDLVSYGWRDRTALHARLILRWIAENPPASGTAWEPYPLSRRIVNWIKWLCAGNAPVPGMVESLAKQTQWLTRRLEYHLLGNHLFANAKALVFAGVFFTGETASKWFATGDAILKRELGEQMLPDGAHFELSTMYHSLAVEDLLDLINILVASDDRDAPPRKALAERCRTHAASALGWMLGMRHPDGEIAFFNDAAIGIAPAPDELADYGAALEIRPRRFGKVSHFAHSGYIHAERGQATLLADVARIGPDYLPGHAHADTLSFELSLGLERFLVNGGTSLYGTSPERNRQRGTAAHNTVIVDGENSSEVWAGFRVGRRAYPFDVTVRENDEAIFLAGAHDGYRWLAGKPLHRRSWTLDSVSLTVTDHITAPAGHTARAVFRFHPALLISIEEGAMSGVARASTGRTLRWTVIAGNAAVETDTWHPHFGVTQPTARLIVALEHGASEVRFDWASA